LGYRLERYDESPGLYYDGKGVANLYNVEWKTIVQLYLGKILFGAMDEADARYYNEQIKLFEQNTGDTATSVQRSK
ncbi:hypothetical protein B7P43_G14521, partial [Cryptotermes secundus]